MPGRAAYAFALSIALLAISALHRWEAALELRNFVGLLAYRVEYAGWPLPYLELWLNQEGGVEYAEVLTAYLALDEALMFALSYLLLALPPWRVGHARRPRPGQQR